MGDGTGLIPAFPLPDPSFHKRTKGPGGRFSTQVGARLLWSEVHLLIRTFQWRDLLRLWRLRGRGQYLDLERYVVAGYPLLRLAFRSWLVTDVRTYVGYVASRRVWYLLQVVQREDRPEWDVSFLSPATAVSPPDIEQWQQLVHRAVRDALHKGVYRLYVSLPVESPFLSVFQKEGFRPYSHEVVYRTVQEVPPAQVATGYVRPYRPQDAWEFRRLWQRLTPHVIAVAEGFTAQNGLTIPYSWTPRGDNRIYLWLVNDTLCGAIAVRFGPQGRWVRFLVDTALGDAVSSFVAWGMHQAAMGWRGPIYCALPQHVGGVTGTLDALGFTPFLERILLVRHLAVALQADATAAQSVLSWLEIGGEPAFSRSLEPPIPIQCRCDCGCGEPAMVEHRTKQWRFTC